MNKSKKKAAYLEENLSILKSSSSCSDCIQLRDVQCRNPTRKDIFVAADVLIPLSVKHEPAETHSSHCKSSVSKRRSSKGELTKKGKETCLKALGKRKKFCAQHSIANFPMVLWLRAL